MAYADRQGKAVTSLVAPRAKGVCDDCGELYQLGELRKRMEYYGNSIRWDGFLVCERCNDRPQDQNRTIILPPDPVPVPNPRPEAYVSEYGLQGFTQYDLFEPIYAVQPKAAVLAALASASGVPTPGSINDNSSVIAANNQSQLLMTAKSRQWCAIYNPSAAALQVALAASAVWGVTTNLSIGSGQAILASANVTANPISCIGLLAGAPVYGWDG